MATYSDRLECLVTKAIAPDAERQVPEVFVVESGEKDNPSLRCYALDLATKVESVDVGHGYVQNDHVGFEPHHGFQHRTAISYKRNYLTRGLQQPMQRFKKVRIVIY